MTLSAFCFSGMAIFVKHLARVIPQFELVFFRCLINVLIVLPILIRAREVLFPPGKLRGILMVRGLAGFGGVACLFYAVSHLPLAIATILSWSSPIFVLFFSRIFLREKLSRFALLWIALTFLGLLMTLDPDFSRSKTALPLLAVGVGLLGAVFGGLAFVAVRAATSAVGANTIVFYFVGISTVLSAPFALGTFVFPNGSQAVELLALGVFASAGQFTMTRAYAYAPAGVVSTMNLMSAAFSAFFGWVLFGEVLRMVQWTGIVVMGLGIASLTLSVNPFRGLRGG